jgi:four helix bundle protein
MLARTFEELDIWKKAREIVKNTHLDYSKGSCWEVKNMYYLAEDVNYLDKETATMRREACEYEKNSIAKFMNHLKKGYK